MFHAMKDRKKIVANAYFVCVVLLKPISNQNGQSAFFKWIEKSCQIVTHSHKTPSFRQALYRKKTVKLENFFNFH